MSQNHKIHSCSAFCQGLGIGQLYFDYCFHTGPNHFNPGIMSEYQTSNESFELESTIPAGFWIRVGAYFIDIIILLPIYFVGNLLFKTVEGQLGLLVVMVAYKPLMEGLFGGTIGKLVIDLRVLNAEGLKIGIIGGLIRSGLFILPNIPSFMYKAKAIEQGIARENDPEIIFQFLVDNKILIIATLVLMLIALISCIVVAFTERNRGLHDMIADTYVIKLDKGKG